MCFVPSSGPTVGPPFAAEGAGTDGPPLCAGRSRAGSGEGWVGEAEAAMFFVPLNGEQEAAARRGPGGPRPGVSSKGPVKAGGPMADGSPHARGAKGGGDDHASPTDGSRRRSRQQAELSPTSGGRDSWAEVVEGSPSRQQSAGGSWHVPHHGMRASRVDDLVPRACW